MSFKKDLYGLTKIILYAAKSEMFVIPIPAIKRLIYRRARYSIPKSFDVIVFEKPDSDSFCQAGKPDLQGRGWKV